MHGLQTGIVVDNVHGMSVCLMVITMSCAETAESLDAGVFGCLLRWTQEPCVQCVVHIS